MSIYKELLDSFNMHAKWQVLSKNEEVSFTRKQRKKKFRKRNDGNVLYQKGMMGIFKLKLFCFLHVIISVKRNERDQLKDKKVELYNYKQTKRF